MASRAILIAGLLLAAVVPAEASYDQAFVDAFAAACVPERLSYEGTQKTALAAGWAEVAPDADPELASMMAISEAAEKAAAAEDPDMKMSGVSSLYAKDVEGLPHYLVISRTEAVLTAGEAPWAMIGCYLYNFAAEAVIAPEPVTALIGNPISNSQLDMHISGYVWGPPPAMPRTFDTYLTFIPEVSQYKAQTGFSGLVLKFSTSEPEVAR